MCVPIGNVDIDASVGGSSTNAVVFPGFTLGGTPVQQTITISNKGTGDLIIGNIANPTNGDFVMTTDNCSSKTLTPTATCSIVMSFSTSGEGSSTGTLLIPSNDTDENPLNLTLRGTTGNDADNDGIQRAVLGDSEAAGILTRLDGGVGGLGVSFILTLLPLALRRRRLLATTVLLGLSATASAEQGQFYVGGGFGMSQLEPKTPNSSSWKARLRPRERFWDIPVPKIDSAFDNLLVPQPSWSLSATQQLRKLVAAPHSAPI